MNLASLKTETDKPVYAALSEQEKVDYLNTVDPGGGTVTRESVNTADIIKAIYSNATEFFKLSQTSLLQLILLSPVGNIDPTSIQEVIKLIFDEAEFPTIRAALIALAKRPATRGELITDIDHTGLITTQHVHDARKL